MNQTQMHKETIKDDVNKVKEEAGKLADDAGKAAKEAGDAATEAFTAGKKMLELEAQRLSEGLKNAASSAVKTGETAMVGVQDQIQEKPIVSAAAALGIGFVLGLLISRRN
jgi:ElaB/YqjD/DUF883 family membrane-anchored ribosome-binding protein